MTETFGLGMYSETFRARAPPSSSAVRPMAGTSFRSGSEIFPSGLTGTVRLIASLSFFHTEIRSKSAASIRYTSGTPLRQESHSDAVCLSLGSSTPQSCGQRSRAPPVTLPEPDQPHEHLG